MRVDFMCAVNVQADGRVYPAAFTIMRDTAGRPIRRQGKIHCKVVDHHRTGFDGSSAGATAWRSDCDAPILPGINTGSFISEGTCLWFSECDLRDLIQEDAVA